MTDPKNEYSRRLEIRLQTVSTRQRLHLRVGYAKLAVIAAGLALAWFIFARHFIGPYLLILPVALHAFLAVFHAQVLRARAHANTAAEHYRRGITRIEDRWSGTGQPGDRFRDPTHVYAEDLDLFGRGCLFELLSTARLPLGENCLARWLCAPAELPVILERHGMIQELREKLDLREELAITGEDLRVRLDPESLLTWAESKRALPARAWRAVAPALAVLAAAGVAYYFATGAYWPLLFVLMLDAAFLRWLRQTAIAVVEGVHCNAEGLALFARILERLEREAFLSPRLQRFTAQFKQGPEPASRVMLRLARIVYWIDSRDNLLTRLSELPFLYTIQVAFAAEAWRRDWGGKLRAWADIVGEIEALLSLAAYSYEHPADVFPEFVNGAEAGGLFDGEELGHPLIPVAQCVPNSVRLDKNTRVILVSGSNMSGKSTLLRTVGVNAVLAMAGAPIRGKRLRLSPLTIGTRIRTSDSLQEGRSGFYTEILHIRKVFELTAAANPLLFLFDELMEGTNSNDRRIGAESLLQSLLKRGAIGIVTTHDLALTEIAASVGTALHNMHFQDHVEDGKMRFDYRLREGIVAKSNALELMRLIGLET